MLETLGNRPEDDFSAVMVPTAASVFGLVLPDRKDLGVVLDRRECGQAAQRRVGDMPLDGGDFPSPTDLSVEVDAPGHELDVSVLILDGSGLPCAGKKVCGTFAFKNAKLAPPLIRGKRGRANASDFPAAA
ncbi:hypothetical protein [Salinibacter ruber]|uniref:Uncharacterized protein n=1 Tax=Salinibacter ruber TaxID=146919 RepID=A0A9X3A0A0_9BACT|nr:hypothetical protein [Salinibacter ruber]MCS4038307.1 hypothetical protein [Salinibacter ruber]